MPTSYRAYEPGQKLLMPPDLAEWIPAGHLAHHVSDLVDGLDLGEFYERYEGDGRRNRPYEPSMMLKVLIYGYATGVFSSRKIAKKLEEDVAFRMLGAGNFPKHRTISEFRRRHLGAFERLFVEVVRVAGEMGLVSFGTLSVDGTKVRANASKRKAMSYGRMGEAEERLRGEIAGMVREAEAADEAEDGEYGEGVRGDEMPEGFRRREERLAAIAAAKKRLEDAQREADAARGRKPGEDRNPKGGMPYKREYGEPAAKSQSNFTDPESGIMKTSGEGFQQCYNAQMVVDGEGQIVVGTHVDAKATDQGQLMPLLDEVKTNYEAVPEVVLADAGYCNEEDLRELETRGIDGHVAVGREGKAQTAVNPEKRPATQRMGRKLGTPKGRACYARRKWLSEAPNGWIKEVMGFRRFSLRGLQKVRGEWNLVCLALNIKRLGSLATCAQTPA